MSCDLCVIASVRIVKAYVLSTFCEYLPGIEHFIPVEMDFPSTRLYSRLSLTLMLIHEICQSSFTGAPTNFDILARCKTRWESQVADETRGDYCTTYQGSFIDHPEDALVRTHHAISRENSTALLPTNKINKDLHLRNVSAFKSPERLPAAGIPSISC